MKVLYKNWFLENSCKRSDKQPYVKEKKNYLQLISNQLKIDFVMHTAEGVIAGWKVHRLSRSQKSQTQKNNLNLTKNNFYCCICILRPLDVNFFKM